MAYAVCASNLGAGGASGQRQSTWITNDGEGDSLMAPVYIDGREAIYLQWLQGTVGGLPP